jgi:hypothetical protein
MKIEADDDCKGCSFGEHDDLIQCRIKKLGRSSECPCIRCLLKSSCTCYCPPWAKLAAKAGHVVET